jgi:hypothetical protein
MVLSLPPDGNCHGNIGDTAGSPRKWIRYLGLLFVHGSEAVARPTGTCADAETIVKPEAVERAETGATLKPGTTEVSDQETDVSHFQEPKSAAGTRVRQGPSTESTSDVRLRTLEEFLGEDQDDGEAAAQIQALYEEIDWAGLTGKLEMVGVSDMTKSSEHQEEPDLTPVMGISEESDPVEIDGGNATENYDMHVGFSFCFVFLGGDCERRRRQQPRVGHHREAEGHQAHRRHLGLGSREGAQKEHRCGPRQRRVNDNGH